MSTRPPFDIDKTLVLIDGSSFLYRSYYGLRPIHTSKGVPVQAVFNFCRMIRKLIDDFTPHYLVIAWDSKGKTERHAIFPDYKATRQAPPSDLFTQKEKIVEFSDLIGVRQLALPGVEADDIMFSLAQDAVNYGNNVILVTADKDMGQMVNDRIVIFDWFKDEYLDATSLEQKFGFPVKKVPFYYSLIGDSSDNIPGVEGIGKVGATELVNQFDSLEDLYANLDKVNKERTRVALEANKENAFLSHKLFLLKYHDMKMQKGDVAFDAANWSKARSLFEELEFKSLLKDIDGTAAQEVAPKIPLSQAKGYQFITVTDAEQLAHVIAEVNNKKVFAFDTEADSLDPLKTHLMGISICTEPGTSYYIPCGHATMEAQLQRDYVLEQLKPTFENPSIKKYLQHTKYDELVLSQYGINVEGVVFDTMIAAHLVTKDWQRVGLKFLSQYYLNEEMLTFSDTVKKNGYKHFGQVPLALATEYAAADAHQTLRLVPILEKELREQGMEKLFYDIEMPLAAVLIKMEKEGIYLDVEVLKKLDQLVTLDLRVLEQKINELTGHKENLNLNSPKQLEQLLFHDLKLPVQKKTKTGYSTDQEVLEALVQYSPVPALIIKYRELFKLKSTYIDALPAYINERDNKIHTTFSQTSVATGRLSSSDPNLQNIPVHTGTYDVHVRSAFKAQGSHIFISADYSQIELRVLAYLSDDKNLKDAFAQGRDIHAETASKLFDIALDKVTSDQRRLAKQINFSILYGLTPYGLSKELGIPFGQAKHYIEKYFAQYPGVSAWMDGVIEEAKKFGYVTTHWGRRRYLPGIYEKNRTLYELACRVAINTKAQGTAAELMKIGMINLQKELNRTQSDARILLQIHDELLITVPQSSQASVQKTVKEVLESVVNWDVPLTVDIGVGATWQDTA